jgi:hypothetical protein
VRRSAFEDRKGVILFATNASERETVSGVIDVGRDRRVERSVFGAIRGNGRCRLFAQESDGDEESGGDEEEGDDEGEDDAGDKAEGEEDENSEDDGSERE